MMRLLLAEDEEQLSRAVATVLRHNGYEVDTAENGSIAVKLARTHSYDCIILDIMMPKKDGRRRWRTGSADWTPERMII